MADPGLLSRLAACALLVAVVGCFTPGRMWFRTVEGRVVDAETGDPIAGAEVFATYSQFGTWAGGAFDTRWATTDEDGRFEIPGHFRFYINPPLVLVDRYPSFSVWHPAYGLDGAYHRSSESFPGWRDIEVRMKQRPRYLEDARDPRQYPSFCVFVTNPGCRRMCEVVYGSLEACYEGGLRRP